MTFGFHPEAEAEFKDAVAFYEDHAEGLGLDFAAEVREAMELAIAMPMAWAQVEAVMHLRRAPDYWAHHTADIEGGGE